MNKSHIEYELQRNENSWTKIDESVVATRARQYELDLIFAGEKLLGSQRALAGALGIEPSNFNRYVKSRPLPHGKVCFMEYGIFERIYQKFRESKDWKKAVVDACSQELPELEAEYIVKSLGLEARKSEIEELLNIDSKSDFK